MQLRRRYLEKTKSETFVGFCIRARKCKIGANAVQTLKRAKLIIVCDSASENTKKDGAKFSERFHCPMLIAKGITLDKLTHKENAKIMAVTDDALSKAILGANDNVFIKANQIEGSK